MFGTSRLVRFVLFVVLGLLAIFAEAAPLGHAAGAMPSPDLLFLVAAFVAVRRPGLALMLVIFVLGVVRDLLTDAPVGAGALSLYLAAEGLRALSPSLRPAPFAAELVTIAAALAASLAVQWLMVFLTLLPPPPAIALARQWALTVALYPVVALILRWAFRIGWRRPTRM